METIVTWKRHQSNTDTHTFFNRLALYVRKLHISKCHE